MGRGRKYVQFIYIYMINWKGLGVFESNFYEIILILFIRFHYGDFPTQNTSCRDDSEIGGYKRYHLAGEKKRIQ